MVSVNAAGTSPEQMVKVVLLIVPAVTNIFSNIVIDATAEQPTTDNGFDVTSTRTISLSFNKTGGVKALGLNCVLVPV